MNPRQAAALYITILALMYIPPFTLLHSTSPLALYAYWTLTALAALALAKPALKGALKHKRVSDSGEG